MRWLAVLLLTGCVREIRVPVRVTSEGEYRDPIDGCREICLRTCEGAICTDTGQDVKVAVVLPDRRVGCVCQPFRL